MIRKTDPDHEVIIAIAPDGTAIRGDAHKPQMIVDHTIEEPLMCAVCGCKWLEEQAPEENCPEATCPCHHKYWLQTDGLIRRWLDGDR